MTIFDTETDRYLERLGASHSSADWNDVVQRSDRARRHSRVTRAAVGVGAAAAAAAVALAAVGALGGPGSTSIVRGSSCYGALSEQSEPARRRIRLTYAARFHPDSSRSEPHPRGA